MGTARDSSPSSANIASPTLNQIYADKAFFDCSDVTCKTTRRRTPTNSVGAAILVVTLMAAKCLFRPCVVHCQAFSFHHVPSFNVRVDRKKSYWQQSPRHKKNWLNHRQSIPLSYYGRTEKSLVYRDADPTLRAITTTPTETCAIAPVSLKFKEFPSSVTSTHHDSHHLVMHEPPVIILHGILGSKRNFSTIGISLARQLQKKRRIIAADLRNHGDNSHDWRDEMSYIDMANDVIHLLDNQGISTAVLVGHSMGGKVAQACALLQPHRVCGLIVLDIAPVAYSTTVDGSWAAIKDIIHALSKVDLNVEKKSKKDVDGELRHLGIADPALRAFVLTNLDLPDQGNRSDSNVNVGPPARMRWRVNVESIAKQLDVLAGFNLTMNGDEVSNSGNCDTDTPNVHLPPTFSTETARISQLVYKGDAFFIQGGASRFIRSGHLSTIAKYFPSHMITTIRGAGHWVHAEAPDNTLALLKRYLDR